MSALTVVLTPFDNGMVGCDHSTGFQHVAQTARPAALMRRWFHKTAAIDSTSRHADGPIERHGPDRIGKLSRFQNFAPRGRQRLRTLTQCNSDLAVLRSRPRNSVDDRASEQSIGICPRDQAVPIKKIVRDLELFELRCAWPFVIHGPTNSGVVRDVYNIIYRLVL